MKRKRWERVLAALLTIILFCSSTGAEDLFTSDSNVNDLYAGFQDESNQDDSFEEVDLADEADLTRAAEGLNQESAEENELSQEDFFSSVSDLPEGMEQPGSEYDGDMFELTGGYEEEAGPEVQESIYSEEEILFTDGMNETEEDPLAVVSAESDFEIDEDGNLISYTGAAEIVTIPESVTSIAYGAFQNCETMKKVIIQNDLDAIGEYAFYGCTNLEEVVFPENVRGLGLYAFEYCTSLKEISFGNGLPEIPDSAFYGCQSLTSVTMPDTVTRIGAYAFYECGSLTEIHFSKELTQIDRNAFDYCDSLTELHLPGGVSDIYLYYSYNDRIYCSTYDCVTARVVSRSGSGFFVEGEPRYLFRYVTEEPEEGGESEEKLALARYLGEEENVTVPGYIEHLYDHAFQYTNVVEVTIPDGVTMGNTVFDHCESLERVNLPSDLTTIPIHTFNSCRKLTEISLPSGVAEIGYYAFSGCESLREIVLPCISEIPDSAFYGCQNLTTVTMPDTVTRIGTNAFYDCGSLTEIHFSSELTQIDRNAFYGCGNLTELHLPGGISEIDLNYSFYDRIYCPSYDCMTAQVVSRSGSSFLVEGEPRYLFRYVAEEPEEGGESEEKLALVRYLGEEENVTVPGYIEHLYDEAFRYTNVVEVNIPDGMTMGNIVFDHCENLERVNLPSDLTTIPIHTFNSCKNLTEISLPTGVTEIGSSAFSGCENLREIILPEGVWLIDDHAFSDCTMLESISLPDTLEALGYSVFYHCDSLKEIHLPDTLMYWYAGAGYPYDSFDIFDECYAKLFCHTQNSSAAALISEDGHCFYLEDDPSLGYRYEIVFEGDHNRYDLWLAEYEKNTKAVVEIPPFVDKIASYLFSEDETIKRVEIPEGVTSIGENFYGCPALSEVVVPSSVEEIIWPSFYGSPNLLMVVQEGSYAERYAIEHEFPYTHSFTISTELKVTLDTDEIESYEGMLLSVKIGETKISRTIKGAKDYVFKNLPKDSTCDIYITNQYGDFIAERNNILLADETTSVTIDNLKRMSAVSATVTDGAADYTEQVTVTWMDEQESVLSVGKILYNVPFGKTILCKVTLPNALAPKYQVPAVASCEADKESVEINISLQPLPKLTVNGIVKCAGDAPAKASVSVAQTINGKYTHNQTVVVGTDGTFSLELLPGKAEFEVSCQEYQTVQFEKVLDGDTDLGEISLMPLVGYKIGVNASYQKAVVASETAQAETLTNLSDLSFIIYNKTGKHEISDFTVQNTDITLLEEAAEGDELEIRVSSRSSVFDDCKGTIQVSSEKAVLNLTIMEHGRLRVTLPSENAGANKLLLYRANGELAWTAETTRVNVDSPSLSAGNYTLIAMQSTEYVETPASLSVLNEMGLKENTDYVKENVEIRNGWIQVTALSSIPAFDAARYYYTDTASTGFYLNKNQVTKARYLTLYAYAPLQEEYVSRAKDLCGV